MPNLTTEEKIDFIYNHIKKEKKIMYGGLIFKFFLYLAILGYAYYFYAYGFSKLIDRVTESLKPNISTESIVDSVKNGGTNLLNGGTLNSIKQKYLNKNKESATKSDNSY